MREAPLLLVVDDEDDARIFLSSLLLSEGYRVASFQDGLEALRYLARARPDLVITDVRMPGLDGLELLEKIREAAPGTPVLAWSAYADWRLLRDTLVRGGVELLSKPASNEAILRAVERLVGVRT